MLQSNGDKATAALTEHSAKESLLGYLYQCRYALLAGIDECKQNPSHTLSIEKFDDVAFESEGEPIQLIQTKHHTKPGNLTDNSVDIWKTILIWIKRIKNDPQAASECRFVFLTTEIALVDSALFKLRKYGKTRDVAGAMSLLETAAKTSQNLATKAGREEYLNLDSALRTILVANIWVFDRAPEISNVREEIEDRLFYSAPRDKLTTFTDHLEGWWYKRVIACLVNSETPSIPINTIQDKIDELRDSFRIGALPLDDEIDAMPPVEILPADQRSFVRQLRLVSVGQQAIRCAVHDFYRASAQRSQWARQNLLLDGEVERYDRSLHERWQRRFATMQDETASSTDEEIKAHGRSLFRWATNLSKPLRNRDELWLSAGSIQILADEVRIGWHVNYEALMQDSAGET